MPQTGNNDPGNRYFDIRPRLIENEKVETRLSRDLDASIDLLAGIVSGPNFEPEITGVAGRPFGSRNG